eukprot:gnl/TRDRNA2_/TRDRNA2_176185_c15_seq1.p2 gnl/TRDRNA2_/TRDRNA2_176185_c15~~gnl/TRDRNA2_/TRDRNA2_176185_c15_seq1.p2  ORF type:complete len:122 (-),score=21.76 gnl/TRDRNA2_/TRDRNA2_176185_c15_seq1:530-895(-)
MIDNLTNNLDNLNKEAESTEQVKERFKQEKMVASLYRQLAHAREAHDEDEALPLVRALTVQQSHESVLLSFPHALLHVAEVVVTLLHFVTDIAFGTKTEVFTTSYSPIIAEGGEQGVMSLE